jgi:hypothetical protein
VSSQSDDSDTTENDRSDASTRRAGTRPGLPIAPGPPLGTSSGARVPGRGPRDVRQRTANVVTRPGRYDTRADERPRPARERLQHYVM